MLARPGFVYLLTNEAFPLLVKVGRTVLPPQIRAAQLGSSTGVPRPFHVYAYWHVYDHAWAETLAHEALSPYRISPRREFFELDPYLAYRDVDIELTDESREVVRCLELQKTEATANRLIRTGHLVTHRTTSAELARMDA